ncbi:MAG: hypothetical protein V4515_15205 [Chloroflexota bacterium]
MADEQKATPEVDRLRAEVEALKGELAKHQEEAGPPQDTKVCYQRTAEGFCRPAIIASAGYTEVMKGPTGMVLRHALIEYGEPPWTKASGVPDHMKAHTFQADRPYNPVGTNETWHYADQCPRKGGPGCPYAKRPEWPPRQARPSVEAP